MNRRLVLVIIAGSHALAMQALGGSHKNTLRGALSSTNNDGAYLGGSLANKPALGNSAVIDQNSAVSITSGALKDPASDGRSGGKLDKKGSPIVSFGGERPVFNDPNATEVGPRNCFTDAQGKPVSASDIASGAIPAGTTLKMVAPSGRSVDVTVEPRSAVATIADTSNNYKYQQVSLGQVRGGAATKDVFGVRPVIGTALSFVGVETPADMDYYAGTPAMLAAMKQGGLNAGPDVYLVMASAPPPKTVTRKDRDVAANQASADGAAAMAQNGNERSTATAGYSRSNLVASNGGGANRGAVGCGNIIGGGGGGGAPGGTGGATPNAPNK